MSRQRPLVASMFQRRLILLMSGVLGVSAVMGAQALWLTAVEGESLLEQAEGKLVSERWTPTIRGRVLDRKGRVLAEDAPSFDVLVDYEVITGEQAYSDAARQARAENADEWPQLGRAARAELVERYLPAHSARWERMWEDLCRALEMDRGEVERRKTRIRRNVQRMAVSVWERWLEERREELNRDRELGEEIEVTLSDVRKPLAVQRQPHLLARGVSEQAGFDARRLSDLYGGIVVEHSGRRAYPASRAVVEVDPSHLPGPVREQITGLTEDPGEYEPISVRVEGVATHVLGWLREAQREDFESRPRKDPTTGEVDRGHYQPGDSSGAQGIERVAESSLRGLRGRIVRHLDTGEEEIVEPDHGADVHLTIDAALQARVQAAMDPRIGLAQVQPWHFSVLRPRDYENTLPDGTPLYGAAVVLEVDSGDILAMVSTPSFTLDQLYEDPESVFEDRVRAPWVNKALAKPYPPGSIVKPMVLVDAVTTGIHPLNSTIRCDGYLLPNLPNNYRCWIWKQYSSTHSSSLPAGLIDESGGLGGRVALGVSCNVYFQTLARQMGLSGILSMYRRYGVGRTYDLGVGDEYPGIAGGQTPEGRLMISHAILMGIGQGPVAWTPLHAADAYATLARGGLRLAPRLRTDERPRAEELIFDPAAVDEALAGLRESVNANFGTGHELRYPDGTVEPIFSDREGIEIVGKTGTAQAPHLLSEPDPETGERTVLRQGDHSWFVILAGERGRPAKYAISVIMEYSGSGGRVSGPICNQIVQALVEEGYL